jgi:hypothetical protein
MSTARLLIMMSAAALFEASPSIAAPPSCTGDACDDIVFSFVNGCYHTTNHSTRRVVVRRGPYKFVVQRGETHVLKMNGVCIGSYVGKNTADFERPNSDNSEPPSQGSGSDEGSSGSVDECRGSACEDVELRFVSGCYRIANLGDEDVTVIKGAFVLKLGAEQQRRLMLNGNCVPELGTNFFTAQYQSSAIKEKPEYTRIFLEASNLSNSDKELRLTDRLCNIKHRGTSIQKKASRVAIYCLDAEGYYDVLAESPTFPNGEKQLSCTHSGLELRGKCTLFPAR